jgi:hypothetical protein
VRRVSLIVILGFLAVGGVFIATGAKQAWSMRTSLPDSGRAEGKVVKLAQSQGKNGQALYAPVFQYEVHGTIYRVHGRSASSSPAYEVGEEVTVVYPKARPAEGVIDNFSEMWLPSIGYGGLGLVCVLIGLAIHWWRARLGRNLAP